MIVSRTPARISFLGGGSDYEMWFKEHGGAVISTTIDKYVYVSFHNGKLSVNYDLPTKAGLGTSSAFTVGLLRVCTKFDQKMIAQLATVWETDKLDKNIGVQDQYICSVGGFRLLRFSEAGIRDIQFTDIDWLNPYLMLFNTHQYRLAGGIVANQLKEMKKHSKLYERLMDIVDEGKLCLDNKDYEGFGNLLDELWKLKRQLSKVITTPSIDAIYELGIKAGAIGGKLIGAGGGGMMIFLAPLDKQEDIKKKLTDCEYINFKFEKSGTQIIFKDEI